MPLQVTPVNRNLQTRVTFMLLELEDLFIVLGAAAIMNVVGHFVGGEVAGMPMSIVLQYGVPLLMVPVSSFCAMWKLLTIRETAEVLGTSEANVKTRLSRARLHARDIVSSLRGAL